MSTSIARFCGSVSGMASLSFCCVWCARCRAPLALFIARVNGRVRSAPNSATAMSSSSRAWRTDSSVATMASWARVSSVSTGRRSIASVSSGESSRAVSSCWAEVFFLLRRETAQMPAPAPTTATPPAPSQAADSPEIWPEVAAPSTAARPAPAQSDSTSGPYMAASMSSSSWSVQYPERVSAPMPYWRSSVAIAATRVFMPPLAAAACSVHCSGVYWPNDGR